MTHQTTPEANRLLLDGQIALASCEEAGVRVDKTLLDTTIKKMEKDIADLELELKHNKVGRLWRKVYKEKTNYGNRNQLADVLFNKMGIKSEGSTAGGKRQSTAKEHLDLIDIPFVRKYLKIEPMKTSLRTNLLGIRKAMIQHDDGNWYVHPSHNLNTTQTFRSSSNDPNWKNYPKRNKDIAAIVRPIFIARPGFHFGERDYSQIEIRVPAAITGDAELNRYINLGKEADMHKDQAAACFLLKPNQVNKDIRQSIKTPFVFASFYGSPWYNTSKNLWQDIDRYKLKLDDGTPLKKHLKQKGIDSLGVCDPDTEPEKGTFAYHIKQCEKKLWKRFGGYREWKDKQVESYRREGGLTMVTGFAVTGIHSRTEIANYGIQGPAFHCTLWSLIRLVKWFRKYKMKSKVLGEIYDSIQFDIYRKELQDVLEMSHEIMVNELPKVWDWITVPLETEVDVSPKNGSWWSAKEWQRNESGVWSLKA